MKHRIPKQPRFRQSRVEPLEPRRLLAALDFTAHVATPGDVAPDLIYTEINRNDRTDVLAMDVDERAIRWWEASDSRGRFPSTSTVLVEGVDQFIVSDMNRDGWIDLVTLSRLDGEVAIYWNLFRYENSHTGQRPTFSESPSVIISQPGVIDFDLADFNRDGFRDLVVVTQQEGSNTISWMARDGVDAVGEIVWHTPVLIAEGRKLTYQTSIDFDVDAHNDLLAISETSDFVWFRNSGNGKSFQRRTLLKDVQLDHDAPIALANMNGDGYPDIVAVTIEDSTRTVAWYRNESCGEDCYTQRTLRLGGIVATDRQAISAIAVTDIDGDNDNDNDFVLAQADSPQVSWIENSEGDFQNEYVMVNLNGTSVSPALRIIDAERDGDRDFLYASGGRVGLLLNDIETRKGGFWRFVSSSSVSSQSPEVNFAVGDHDLDGDADFVATRNNGVVTYRNDGHANFSQSQYLKPAQDLAYREPTLGDFDGDGDLDLFVRQLRGGERDENPGDIYYFENVAGVFAPAELVAANILRYSVDDLDGDGIPEVIAVTADTKDFDVYQFASETYRFSQQLTASFGGSPWFKVLDAEKDSDNDIVFGGPWSHLSWLENLDGKGRSFERNTISTYLEFRTAWHISDVNSNGINDLVVTGYDEECTTVGDDVFFHRFCRLDYGQYVLADFASVAAELHWLASDQSLYRKVLDTVDLDNDGDRDIILSVGSGLHWQENLGDWQFAEPRRIRDGFGSVAVADFDGDGDKDLLSRNGQILIWHESNVLTPEQGDPDTIRINVGGDEYVDANGNVWEADRNFTSGLLFSTEAEIANTVDDPLYQTERYGADTGYEFPVANGTYDVEIHFAEIYFEEVGERVFDVLVEGNRVAEDFDLVAETGGRFEATSIVFRDVEVDDNLMELHFTANVNNAKLSAVEVRPAATTNPQEPAVTRINAGGPSYVDADGHTWQADENFTRGFTFSTEAEITGTSNDTLFQTERYGGNFGYEVPVQNGTYDVEVYLAEIYFEQAGERVFDISIEGEKVTEGLDLIARTGSRFSATSVLLTDVLVNDGVLNLDFAAQVNNGKVSGFEILPATIADVLIPGDADGDGEVAFPDFLILASNFGNEGSFEDGDFDHDGFVSFSDFLVLARNFGSTD